MTTLREAAQQALEALQNCANGEDDVLLTRDALAALRAALAEPVQGPDPWGAGYEAGYAAGVAEHRAEPVQAPVAWRYKAMIGMPWSLSDDGYYISCKRDQRYFVEALYAAPPQRKENT